MIRIVNFTFDGNDYPLFIDDTATGYNGKDILTKPGAYEEVTEDEFSLPIVNFSGHINGYATKLMGLVANVDEQALVKHPVMDCTNLIKNLLTVPETAAKMLISAADEDTQDFMQAALDTIHFYETVTETTKVFLPDSAFDIVGEEVATSMKASGHVYALKSIDNQEFMQKDCQSPYGIVLPDVEDLHGDATVTTSSLDILRVIAPCRRELQPGVFQYNGIYHTPYFKVDPKIRGAIPSYLASLNGYPKNDKLGIQPFERHMADNLMTLVRADTARYTSEIVTALLMSTPFGQSVRRICTCHSVELLQSLVAGLQGLCPAGISISLSYDEMTSVESGTSAASLIAQALEYDPAAIVDFVESTAGQQHIADTRNLPFVLDIENETKAHLTDLLISNGVISIQVHEYIISLCCRAYEVNWGHSGAVRAIPRFVLPGSIEKVDEVMAHYIQAKLTNRPAPANIDFSVLYPAIPRQSDNLDEFDGGDEDEIFTQFDYYITNDTAYKLRAGTLPNDYFFSQASGAETSEANIVEYWRKVNGTNNLSYFVSSSFTRTGDVGVLIESFLKLMRWGDMKPSLLMYTDYPEWKTAFDLNQGKEIPNVAAVDESQLVLSNGCKYSLEAPLVAPDILGPEPALVGFLLSSNYGIKKFTLASLVDIGEMSSRGEMNVDIFKTVQQINLGAPVMLTDLVNEGYDFYTSNYSIERGLEYNAPSASFSELALLIQPGVLRSPEYLKAAQSQLVITTKDRQYQNLKTYSDTVRTLYREFGDMLRGAQIGTAEMAKICEREYQLFVSGAREQAPDANNVRAAGTIASLNLDGGIQYDERELSGKFAIVSDIQMQSFFPAIEFTDPQLVKLSERLSNRIVLLLLETEDSYILCRKAIYASDILIRDGKIEHKRYSSIAQLVDGLRAGRRVSISDPKTGAKKPAKLHASLKEFIA